MWNTLYPTLLIKQILPPKYPTDDLLYHVVNAYFEWSQKHAVFVHVSSNANELLLPTLFSRRGLCIYSFSVAKICGFPVELGYFYTAARVVFLYSVG